VPPAKLGPSTEQGEAVPGADSPTLENEIFVSYSKEDVARVQILVAAMEKEGWKVFWDQEILPGEDWESYIGIHLDAATVVIAVWSTLSVKSRYVRSEINRANKRNVVVPVLIDAVEPPFGFDHIQAADLAEWTANGGGALPPRLKSSILRRIPLPSAEATIAPGTAGILTRMGAPTTTEDPRKEEDELERARQARQEAERELAELKADIEAQRRRADPTQVAQRTPAAHRVTEETAQRQVEAKAIAHAEEKKDATIGPSKISEQRPDQEYVPAWRQPFAQGYVAAGFVTGILAGAWAATIEPDSLRVFLIGVAGGGAGATLGALLCGIWPGYNASPVKLFLAASFMNPALYIALLAFRATYTDCYVPRSYVDLSCGALALNVFTLALILVAPVASVAFREKAKRKGTSI
jgi:hypothetical protein